MQKSSQNWQQIIWREWRHCLDAEYGKQLFELVADEPVGWSVQVSLTLFTLVSGTTIGVLIGFPLTLDATLLQQFAIVGGVIGAARGFIVSRHLSWRDWLIRLESNTPTTSPGRLFWSTVLLGLCGFMLFGPVFWLVIAGLFWALGDLITWLNRSIDKRRNYNPEDRKWWFWWRDRPHLFDLEIAIQRACQASATTHNIWTDLLSRLKASQQQPKSPDDLITALLNPDWAERFIARYRLVSLGQEAVAPLEALAERDRTPLRETVLWLLENIEQSPAIDIQPRSS